jgi:hypothetical protein
MTPSATLTDEQPSPAVSTPPKFVYLSDAGANTSSVYVSALNEPPSLNQVRKGASFKRQSAGFYAGLDAVFYVGLDAVVLVEAKLNAADKTILDVDAFLTTNIGRVFLEPFMGSNATLTVLGQPRFEFSTIVQQLKFASELPYRHSLASRIEELLEDWEEVPPAGATSLRMLIQFLKERPNWKAPRLYATDAGMFGAEWEGGLNRLSVYATSGGRARFALIQGDGTHLGGTVRWGQLAKVLTESVGDWFK